MKLIIYENLTIPFTLWINKTHLLNENLEVKTKLITIYFVADKTKTINVYSNSVKYPIDITDHFLYADRTSLRASVCCPENDIVRFVTTSVCNHSTLYI